MNKKVTRGPVAVSGPNGRTDPTDFSPPLLIRTAGLQIWRSFVRCIRVWFDSPAALLRQLRNALMQSGVQLLICYERKWAFDVANFISEYTVISNESFTFYCNKFC